MTKELQIEKQLIDKLVNLKYSYRPDIRTLDELEANFRQKFETLNRVNLTNGEFSRLMEQIISADTFKNAQHLRQRNSFERDDGTPLNYTMVNTTDWCKNHFEVVNQLRINTKSSHHRYDVILLINGVPVVQIELKTLAISPRRAMQQIVDYKNDDGNGYRNTLMGFMQLFIVSNRSDTWYFANNNNEHFAFDADERFLPLYQFADEQNQKITHLDDFADQFLAKCTLGQMISRYMVLVATEKKLMMMRPYQIYAVKAIVECIHQNRGNGYIWHTTGSGKTLTSFKASTLLKDNPDIEKCLFVVDRKDLDRQTREEFNKFQENSVEENTNTEMMVRRLLSEDYADKVIVTTIQKLGIALDAKHKKNYKERLKPLANKRIAFIFDECHRSQFGENHEAIKTFFPNAQLFGFTGTPILGKNSNQKIIDAGVNDKGEQTKRFKTTQDVFEKELHRYTITHAIEDRNVLRFHVDYFKPESQRGSHNELAQEAVVKAILDKHDKASNHRRFNAILATASINNAISYYALFKAQQAKLLEETPSYVPLNIACVFSPPAEGDKDVKQLQEDLNQEREDNQHNPEEKKAALNAILKDYNAQYSTNHSIHQFDHYYKDVQQRIKDQKYSNADYSHPNKIDITIVVDMLLTGFDSKYLNTLYVDKNLKYHGLIQAFSRTNRVLNDTKPYGKVMDFRAQESAVNEAISMFSGGTSEQDRQIWLVDPAPKVIEDFDHAVQNLQRFMQAQGLSCTPQDVPNLKGDNARGEFINHFKEIQRLKTQLDQYTDLTEDNQTAIDAILPKDELQGFRGVYIDIAHRLKTQQEQHTKTGKENEALDQLDFEFVLFSSAMIDYDYIMGLIANYTRAEPAKQELDRQQLIHLLASNANLYGEREDITEYINTLEMGKALNETDIKNGFEQFKQQKANQALNTLAQKHELTPQSLQAFVDEILDRMIFDGEKLTDLMEPLGLGWKDRRVKELALMDELIPLLKKYANEREISGLAVYEEE